MHQLVLLLYLLAFHRELVGGIKSTKLLADETHLKSVKHWFYIVLQLQSVSLYKIRKVAGLE